MFYGPSFKDVKTVVKRIAPCFGGINLEDISAPRCFEIERRLKEELDSIFVRAGKLTEVRLLQ